MKIAHFTRGATALLLAAVMLACTATNQPVSVGDAEGLGYKPAAQIYYRRALVINNMGMPAGLKCGFSCNGLNIALLAADGISHTGAATTDTGAAASPDAGGTNTGNPGTGNPGTGNPGGGVSIPPVTSQ